MSEEQKQNLSQYLSSVQETEVSDLHLFSNAVEGYSTNIENDINPYIFDFVALTPDIRKIFLIKIIKPLEKRKIDYAEIELIRIKLLKKIKEKYELDYEIDNNSLQFLNFHYPKFSYDFVTYNYAGFYDTIILEEKQPTEAAPPEENLSSVNKEKPEEKPEEIVDDTFIRKQQIDDYKNILTSRENRIDIGDRLKRGLGNSIVSATTGVKVVVPWKIDTSINGIYNNFFSKFDLGQLIGRFLNDLRTLDPTIECIIDSGSRFVNNPNIWDYLQIPNTVKIGNLILPAFDMNAFISDTTSIFNFYDSIVEFLLRQITNYIVLNFISVFDFASGFINGLIDEYVDPNNTYSFIKNRGISLVNKDTSVPSSHYKYMPIDFDIKTYVLKNKNEEEIKQLLSDFGFELSFEQLIDIIKNLFRNFNINQLKSIVGDEYNSSMYFIIKQVILLVIKNFDLPEESYQGILLILQALMDKDSFEQSEATLDNCLHYDPYDDLTARLGELGYENDIIVEILSLQKDSARKNMTMMCKILKGELFKPDIKKYSNPKIQAILEKNVDNVMSILSINKYGTLLSSLEDYYYKANGNALIGSIIFDLNTSNRYKTEISEKYKSKLDDLGLIYSKIKQDFPEKYKSNKQFGELTRIESFRFSNENFDLGVSDQNLAITYKENSYSYIYRRNNANLQDIISNSPLSLEIKEIFFNNLKNIVILTTEDLVNEFYIEEYIKFNINLEDSLKFKYISNLDKIINIDGIKTNIKRELE